MNFLEARILEEGVVNPDNVLKVDSFLNHQVDMQLIDDIAKEFHRRFAHKPVTKILTIETSGIPIACSLAREFGVPVVYARKSRSINVDGDTYVAKIQSFVTKKILRVIVSKKFLQPGDHVIIVDDILADGYALQGLISIVESAEATVEGLGIAIEKSFQDGGYRLRNLGYHLESLVSIQSMDPETGVITFQQNA
jgi:xanthine phosphoribosyltransferase